MSHHRKKTKGFLSTSFRRPPVIVIQHAAVGAALAVILLSELSSMYQSSQSVRTNEQPIFRSFGLDSLHSQLTTEHASGNPHDDNMHMAELDKAPGNDKDAVAQPAGDAIGETGKYPTMDRNKGSDSFNDVPSNPSQMLHVSPETEPKMDRNNFASANPSAISGHLPANASASASQISESGFKNENRSTDAGESIVNAEISIGDGHRKVGGTHQTQGGSENGSTVYSSPPSGTSNMSSNAEVRKEFKSLPTNSLSHESASLLASDQSQQHTPTDTVVRGAISKSKRQKKKKPVESTKNIAMPGNMTEKQPPADTEEASSDKGASRFRGVPMPADAMTKAEAMGNFDNVTHLSYMLYRLIKTHRIRSVLDVPCTHTLHWMPQVLHYLDLEVPGFRYYCVVSSEEERERAEAAFGDLASAEYIVASDYWRARLPGTDLGFLWSVVGFVSPQQAWTLMQSVRRVGTKYLVLANYPALRNNPATGTAHGRVNIRRAPYRFTEALRVFNNISIRPDVNKQMLFYDSEHLRADDL